MDVEVEVFVQWSHESSLPVSRTILMVCGGEPAVRETVSVTSCVKGIFIGGEEERRRCCWRNIVEEALWSLCMFWAVSGKISVWFV